MLSDTFGTFSRALEFAGVEKSGEEIRRAIGASDLKTLSEMEHEEGFREKPIGMKSFFREGKSGGWREHLDELSVKKLVESHRDLMERFGYLKEK